jgi:DNA-binding NarL/FixJ family response regulator
MTHVQVPDDDLPDLHLDDPGYLDVLTAREREIAVMLTLGLKNAEIAERLELADQTVKFHLSNIYRKLEVRSRAEVIAMVLGAR